ncbi:MAG: dTDP-4-dehydrorhamnose 3,5-epimerase family protein [Ignavibacteria bacterium]
MSEYYDPENEKGVKWNDPKLNIFWPASDPILSEKDSITKLL